MRNHGTLTKWNDERGFGFITPAGGKGDLFVHISAFPRGECPRLNEMISFEVEAGPDGKQRAVRIMRPGQRASPPAGARARKPPQGRWFSGVLTLVIIGALGGYGYSQYLKRAQADSEHVPPEETPARFVPPPSPYRCDGRTMCSQMTSCAEATYFIRNCPNTEMDGDNDGRPCESQWCN